MTETKEKMPEIQEETKRMGWGVRHIQIACMCFCMTTLIMVRSSMGVAILAMTDTHRNSTITTYEWDKNKQGVILSSFFWGYTAMQVPAGILSKRFGGKPVLLFSLLANAVLSMLVPIFTSVGGWQLVCVCRVATGLAQSFTFPATHTLLGRWLPSHERVLLSGIVYGGLQLGTILGLPISGFLAATPLGWPLVFYAMAGLMLCTAALWYWMTASSPAQHRLMTEEERDYIERNLNGTVQGAKPMRTPWRHILTSIPVWAIVIANVGTAYGFILFFVDMPTYMEKGLGISLKNSATLSALPYIGMWTGSILSTTISEKVYNRGILSATACRKVFNSIASIGISAGLLGLAFGPHSTTLAILWLVGSLTLSGFYTAGWMMNHLDLSPNLAGVMFAVTNFLGNLGCVPTPMLTSFILNNDPTDLGRWRVVFMVAAAVSLTTNAIYVLFSTSTLQPWDDPNYSKTVEDLPEKEKMLPVVLVQEQKEVEKSS